MLWVKCCQQNGSPILTHSGPVMHVDPPTTYAIISSDNNLSPVQYQAIIRTNVNHCQLDP